MRKENESIELTESVYNKISGDKQALIAELKKEKDKLLQKTNNLNIELVKLRKMEEELKIKIGSAEKALKMNSRNKKKITKDMKYQGKLIKVLNKIYREDNTQYIYEDKFYPENNYSKKR